MSDEEAHPDQPSDLRRQAEDKARVAAPQMPENLGALSPDQQERLLHELRVHQIELEMQNDELRRTEARLEASRERYFDLYDLAPVGYLTISEAGLIVEANLAAAGLLGVARGALARQPVSRFVLPEDQDVYYLHRKLLFETGSPQVCELRLLCHDGSNIWARMEATLGAEPDGARVCRAVLSNIDERARAGAALRASEARYRDLVENASDLICTHDLEGVLLSINAAAARTLGFATEDIVGRSLRDMLPGDRQGELSAYLEAIVRDGAATGILKVVIRPGDLRYWEYRNSLRTGDVGAPVVRGVARDVTEQVLAKRALKRSEEKYRTILETMEESYYEVDLAGNLTFFNDSLCRLLGYSREELAGMNNRQYTDAENAKKLYRAFNAVYRTGEPTRGLDWEVTCKDGRRRTIEASVALRKNAAGDPAGFRGIIRDVTEHKRAEAALHDAETRYRLLFEHSPDGIVVLDPRTARPLEFNQTAHGQLGYTREEFARLSLFDLEDLETTEETQSTIAKVVSEGRADFETRQRTKSGEVRNVHVTAQVTEMLGQLVYHCVWRDVTDRSHAEEALRESQEMLRESQRIAGLGSYVLDIGTGLWARTDVLDSVFGVSEDYDRSVQGWAALIHPDDRSTMIDYFTTEVVGRGQAFDREYRIIRHCDQVMRWVHGLGRLEFDAQGHPLRMRGTIQDITERRRAEEALAHSRAQLVQSQKLEAVGRLAGGVAHDFNNILQAMLSLATVLRLRAGSPELSRIVAEIEAHIRRGAGLTQQLLLFSRRQVAERRRLDVGELASVAGVLLRRLIPENIRLSIEASPRPLWVDGDVGQLQQVLMNLAVNAKDAMPGGGTLTVRASERGGEAVVEVIDTGHGMDKETLSRLFEPFFTTKDVGRGTGLGLSVVHGIVEQHGGRVEVESSPSEGSTFRVVLPALPAPEETAAKPGGGAELPGGRGERVLIVEDEAGAREGLAELLTMLGYEVTPVGSGEEAGTLPQRPVPDLLLTDLMLPGIDGASLAAGLRDRWPALKVVLMSGYTEDEAVRREVDEGSVLFLQKPFDMVALARVLRTALDGAVRREGAGP